MAFVNDDVAIAGEKISLGIATADGLSRDNVYYSAELLFGA